MGHLVNGHVLVPAAGLFMNSLFIYLSYFAMFAAVCVLTQFMVNRPQGNGRGNL